MNYFQIKLYLQKQVVVQFDSDQILSIPGMLHSNYNYTFGTRNLLNVIPTHSRIVQTNLINNSIPLSKFIFFSFIHSLFIYYPTFLILDKNHFIAPITIFSLELIQNRVNSKNAILIQKWQWLFKDFHIRIFFPETRVLSVKQDPHKSTRSPFLSSCGF